MPENEMPKIAEMRPRSVPAAGQYDYGYDSHGNYGNTGYIPMEPFGIGIGTNASRFFLDGADGESEGGWTNQFEASLLGAVKGTHLEAKFFSLGIGVDFVGNTVGKSFYKANVGLRPFFYLTNPKRSSTDNILRIGVNVADFSIAKNGELIPVHDSEKFKPDSIEWSDWSYRPGLSLLYMYRPAGFGLVLRAYSEVAGEGDVAYKETVKKVVDGKETTEVVEGSQDYRPAGVTVQGEVFWMPFYDEGDGKWFARGITLYAGGEYSAQWFHWDDEAAAEAKGLKDNVSWGQLMLGLRYSVHMEDGGGLLNVK